MRRRHERQPRLGVDGQGRPEPILKREGARTARWLLVPAAVSLFGRWNWWLPVWLARVLRVEPSPLTAREVPGLPAQRSELAGLDAPGSRRM